MSEYKIQLGVQLDTSDIVSQINGAEKKIDPIKIKIDAETKELTDAIKDALKSLGSGTKNTLTLDTSKIESSFDRVANSIDEIRKSLGSLDGKSGMQSLLSSINQITAALSKAENETDSLVRSLSALAKKDLSLNFDIKLGKSNSIDRNTIFGTKVRNDILPELQKQVKAYEDFFANYYKGKYREGSSPLSGLLTGSSVWEKNKTNIIDVNTRMADSSHLENQIKAYAQYISIIKEAASLKGIDVSSVDSQFSTSADEIVKNAIEIKTGAKEAKESVEQLKSVFGGVDANALSATLKPIVEDLKSIREAIESLSKGTSIDGLTASFNRLSEVLDKVDTNFDKIQNDINTGLPSVDKGEPAPKKLLLPSNIPELQPIDMTEASQIGQNIGRSITQSAEQTLNLNDTIDKEVTELMQKYEIVGEKGSDAFNKIKQAVIECRSALQTIKDRDFDMFGEDKDLLIAHANSEAIDKVTKALAEQIQVANNLGDEYVRLANYMTSFNDPTKGNKVRIPEFVKQEQGDDYKSNRGSLGIAFNTKEGISFVDFINDLNTELGQTISLTNGEAAAMDELLRKLEIGRQQRDVLNKSEKYLNATASTEEILEQNGINRNEIYNDVISIVDSVNAAEQKMAQSSTQSANTVVQNQQRVQQEYRETANAYEKISKDTSLIRDDVSFRQVFEATNQAAQEAQKHFQALLADEKAVVSVTEQFDGNNALQSFTVNVKRASGEVEALRYAMDKLDDDTNNGFVYQGATSSDKNVEKQLEKRIKEKVGIDVSEVTSAIANIQRISPEIDKFETKIDGADVSVESLLNDLSKVKTSGDFSVVNKRFYAFEKAAEAAGIAVKETAQKLKSVDNIKFNIEFGKYANQMDDMRHKINSLSDENVELEQSIEKVENAYKEMLNAAEANSGDVTADRERLIQAEKEYANALEKTNNLIKIQARAEKLADKKTALKLDMANYLKDNSRAAKEFGAEIRRLSFDLDSLDSMASVNNIERKFKNLTKSIKAAGKDGLTIIDKFKAKAKEYMSYLSAAEVFMYIEQGFREMFNTVKEIDTAMTGLYRVTDLTSSQYNTLFDNMISSAKEYGATLNDIINATTDWVRAGFDVDDALGLAEVTTMYQHISDLDYDTAAENLITAYNGFKDELNGAFDGDQVAAVEYVADILNQLDNQFAVTSAGLGDALTRSASALDLAGNSIQETAG